MSGKARAGEGVVMLPLSLPGSSPAEAAGGYGSVVDAGCWLIGSGIAAIVGDQVGSATGSVMIAIDRGRRAGYRVLWSANGEEFLP